MNALLDTYALEDFEIPAHEESEEVIALRALNAEIPLNDFGLPTGIYRTDLLPYHDWVHPSEARALAREERRQGNHELNRNASEHSLQLQNDTDDLEEPTARPTSDNGLATAGREDTSEQEAPSPGTSVTEDVGSSLQHNGVYRIAGFPADQLHHAFVPLQYDEGFPAFANGFPFWNRMEFEPLDAFTAFQRYLSMHQGAKASDPDEDYDGRSASGTRSVMVLAQDLNPGATASQLYTIAQKYQVYFHTYYWQLRAHAYDLYRIAQHRKQQELRALETEDDHYFEMRRIRHRLMQYMNNEEDFWDLMTPKTAIDLLKLAMTYERISAGLPGQGPGRAGGSDEATAKPFEVVLRNVAQLGRRHDTNLIDEEGAVIEEALENPEMLEALQEIIIRGAI